jgi:hypothetical protein
MSYSSSLRDLRLTALLGTLLVAASNCGSGSAAIDGGGGFGATGGGAGGASGRGGTSGSSGSAGTSGSGGTTGVAGSGAGGRGGDGGRGGGAAGRGGSGGGAGGTGGSLTCGTETCTGSQICVRPACGGGTPPQCMPVGDGGQCPSGWTLSTGCVGLGGQGVGCMPPPCTAPAPFCANIPASCSGTPMCGCLPSTICDPPGGQFGGSCAVVNNRQVMCGFA